MFVNGYSRIASRELAGAIVAGANSPARREILSTEARVLNVGGEWAVSTWRGHVRDLVKRGTPTAIGLRTVPSERQLTDGEWSRVVGDLVRQVGPAKRSWALVRITSTSVALLTDAPIDMTVAREYARAATTRYHLGARARPTVAEPDTGPAAADPARQPPAGIAQLSFAAPTTAAPQTAAPSAGPTAPQPLSTPPASRAPTR